jgi:putative ABC transport system permease protein
MITHLFKLINNQWRKNGWIVLELFLVFSVLWYVVDYFSILYLTSRTPVGFDITDTYKVSLSLVQTENPKYLTYEKGSEEPGRNFLRIVDHIRQNPNVEAVSIGRYHHPYCWSDTMTSFYRDSLKANPSILSIRPEYFKVFRVAAADKEKSGQLASALEKGYIISQTLAERLFPGTSAIGQNIYTDSVPFRISGVSNPIKRYLFNKPEQIIYYPFNENSLMKMDERSIVDGIEICFRAKPETGKDFAGIFKQEMKTQLAIGNFLLTDVTPFSELRDSMLKTYGVYESVQYRSAFAIFFLINVFLGVIGTFWLRIEKRKEEIGIRMAVGSPKSLILKQMIGESLLLSVLALIPAIIVWANLVASDLMPKDQMDFTWQRFAVNTVFTCGLVAIAVVSATGYPACRSARIQPAEALHYE